MMPPLRRSLILAAGTLDFVATIPDYRERFLTTNRKPGVGSCLSMSVNRVDWPPSCTMAPSVVPYRDTDAARVPRGPNKLSLRPLRVCDGRFGVPQREVAQSWGCILARQAHGPKRVAVSFTSWCSHDSTTAHIFQPCCGGNPLGCHHPRSSLAASATNGKPAELVCFSRLRADAAAMLNSRRRGGFWEIWALSFSQV